MAAGECDRGVCEDLGVLESKEITLVVIIISSFIIVIIAVAGPAAIPERQLLWKPTSRAFCECFLPDFEWRPRFDIVYISLIILSIDYAPPLKEYGQ